MCRIAEKGLFFARKNRLPPVLVRLAVFNPWIWFVAFFQLQQRCCGRNAPTKFDASCGIGSRFCDGIPSSNDEGPQGIAERVEGHLANCHHKAWSEDECLAVWLLFLILVVLAVPFLHYDVLLLARKLLRFCCTLTLEKVGSLTFTSGNLIEARFLAGTVDFLGNEPKKTLKIGQIHTK